MHTLGLVLLNFASVPDWLLIFLAIVLLFGGKKIPELMRGIGQGVSEFNRAKNNLNTEIQEGSRNQNPVQQQQPVQNQFNSSAAPSNTIPSAPATPNPTDQLQKQIEQLQQQLNQLKQQQP